ncbi:MAG TPA: ATP-binding protein [Leptospiraceae bacterium]|nr:ATP-binding protein [Leptospiraceae bacterium]
MPEKPSSQQCDNEPIHLINELQDFGILLILSLEEDRFLACSDNTFEYAGIKPEELMMISPGQFLENYDKIKININDIIVNKKQQEYKSIFHFRNELYFATFRKSENFFICEIERETYSSALESSIDLLVKINELQAVQDLQSLFDFTVSEVRKIAESDRVVLYRFKEDFSGEVVAESNNGNLPSLMGFHFPSTDIPLPARAMYTKNPIRMIKLNQCRPVRLLKTNLYKEYSFDLGASSLRAPHRHHIEYLNNMGIVSSMSVSLSKDGQLWGLLICHCLEERVPSLSVRNFLSIYSKTVYLQIDALNRNNDSLAELRIQELFLNIIKKINTSPFEKIMDVFRQESRPLLQEFQSDGLYIQVQDQSFRYGSLPSENILQKIKSVLSEKFPGSVFYTDDLKETASEDLSDTEHANGVMSIPLSSDPSDRLIWFREDIVKTVVWAGNKEEAYTVSNSRISPRKSFERWIEAVKGKSEVWSKAYIRAVYKISGIIETIDKKIAEDSLQKTLLQIRKSEQELKQLNATKDKFFSIVSHNLRSPFSGLLGLSELLKASFSEAEPDMEEIKSYADLLYQSSAQAFELLKNLFEWGKVQTGRMTIEKNQIDLKNILYELQYQLDGKLKEKDIHLRMEIGSDLTLNTDENAIKSILNNLLLNSVKYSYPGKDIILRIQPMENCILIEIEDFGIGMNEGEKQKLFKIDSKFRMPGTNGEDGTGLGLIITKEYLDRLNSKIEISTEKDYGTKVKLTFPRE